MSLTPEGAVACPKGGHGRMELKPGVGRSDLWSARPLLRGKLMSLNALPAASSAGAIFIALGTALLLPQGPMAAHMLWHVAVMNLAAPLLAIVILRSWPAALDRPAWLWTATIVQLVLLWGWHAPPAHRAASQFIPVSIVMHTTLLLASLAFWALLTSMSARNRWQAVLALLITGKLACLLGAILIFAPRVLYAGVHEHHSALLPLDDQQLAGLIMIAACPLSYVLAGVIVAAQAMNDLGRQTSAFVR
jgi:putative membrane protein